MIIHGPSAVVGGPLSRHLGTYCLDVCAAADLTSRLSAKPTPAPPTNSLYRARLGPAGVHVCTCAGALTFRWTEVSSRVVGRWQSEHRCTCYRNVGSSVYSEVESESRPSSCYRWAVRRQTPFTYCSHQWREGTCTCIVLRREAPFAERGRAWVGVRIPNASRYVQTSYGVKGRI